ncbi:efflux RND transporter periplasmic adaptor subunit [Magnetococcales bacterium HHB-1]
MKKTVLFTLIFLVGLLIGVFSGPHLPWIDQASISDSASTTEGQSKEKKILYWKAPMDPNYRRDKPGKSPMGMDLVPVYADEGGDDADKNHVKISPSVVNNLGVRTGVVQRRSLANPIKAVGYITYDENLISHIHLRTDGWIEKMMVKAHGEYVKKGSPLFELYSPSLVAAQEEYLRALQIRNRSLVHASEARLSALGLTRAQIRQVAKKKKALQRITYYAPQDGIISSLKVRQGMYVKPAVEVLSLVDLSQVWLLADVFERQAGWVQIGDKATAVLPYLPGKKLAGKVDFIYPELDPKTRTLKVRLRFSNIDNRLHPNMYAHATIESGRRQSALVMPRSALIWSGYGSRVIIDKGEGRFDVRPVRTGLESGSWVEVVSGIEEGVKVVTSAQFLIDSEVNLDAATLRMMAEEQAKESKPVDHSQHQVAQKKNPGLIEGTGIIRKIMRGESKVTLSHAPIPALSWPKMTMDFEVDKAVDLSVLAEQQKVRFELKKTGAFSYLITKMVVDAPPAPEPPQKEHYVAQGLLVDTLKDDNKLRITHDPIAALKWPTMTMDFEVDRLARFGSFQKGTRVQFTLEKRDAFSYVITDISAEKTESSGHEAHTHPAGENKP